MNSTQEPIQLPDGAVYTGETKDDQPHGQGSATWPDGRTYTGSWVFGKRQGEGKATYPDGSTYSGGWDFNMPHGQGAHTWPDGRKYSGSFREGKRHDRGLMIYQDGSVVAGRWKNDVYQQTIPDVPVIAYSFLIGGIIIGIIFSFYAGLIPGVMVLAGGAACWALFLLLDELINRLTEIKYYLAKENKREDN